MFKLKASVILDIRILMRDKVGLTLMFLMPVILAIVITAIQNSTFELVNNNKVPLLLCNKDKGNCGNLLISAIDKAGMFEIKKITIDKNEKHILDLMHQQNALVTLVIPENFSSASEAWSDDIAAKALSEFGVAADSGTAAYKSFEPLILYYHPVLQQSFRQSINGALKSAVQLIESKLILKSLYFSLNEKTIPPTLENEIINDEVVINEIPVARDGGRTIPNATQHNIPAWTIFAMFFIVISLGSRIVREKQNGSFIRLKTLPTNYMVSLVSKQLTYLFVTLLQVVVIFAIGVFIFPRIGLPALNIPADKTGLIIVSIFCGYCAVSFAICIGIFARTEEQANGLGAVSIVLLAAIGGLLVPSFAMPESFQTIMKISPLHWCLEAFYGLFLEGGKLKDILMNILPLFVIIVFIQLISLLGLKRKNLI